MNKSLLKWILIAVVILGAAGYLILSETSSNSKKEQIVVGHSKPFKIEPVEEPAKEKPITGGHWKLIHTGVSTEQGMITGSAKGITIQGSNGHYTAHVERDGMISDREINFEKPKSVYMPGEEITLKVTNEKPKIKGGKEGMSYGEIVFSTGHWDGCVEYKGDRPSYSNKKVVGVAKGSAPSKPGTPGAVGFFITEYIKVYGSMSKISTTYNYAWEE